ncbi:MAG: glycosyltransferase [Planctomycetota bacterium]|nr:glycosyltransferase [Planctomycetota bacterium]
MDLTVAICTRDRAASLARTLEAFERLAVPPGLSWELLVVDNASKDATPRVLERDWSLPLRALSEPRGGKAVAANRALDAATGRWILWTDDDVRPVPEWLAAYRSACARHGDAGYLGGPIRPVFDEAPPAWLATDWPTVGLAFGALDHGDAERALRPHERCNGANFATRTDVARRHRWDETLGPRAGSLQIGAETDLQDRILRSGRSGFWTPAARVDHIVRKEQMHEEYIALRYRLYGRSLMRERRRATTALRSLLCLEAIPRAHVQRLVGLSWLKAFRRGQTHLGKVAGYFNGSRADR